MLNFEFLKHPLHSRAPKGGEVGVNGHFYKGGQIESFYIPRPVMPQVDWDDITALCEFAVSRSCEVKDGIADPNEVKFHQHVDMDKIVNMPLDLLEKPILISQDMFVLDGNHRAEKHKLLGTAIPYIMLRKPFEDALALLYAFPGTYEFGDGNEHPMRD